MHLSKWLRKLDLLFLFFGLTITYPVFCEETSIGIANIGELLKAWYFSGFLILAVTLLVIGLMLGESKASNGSADSDDEIQD